MDDGDMRRIGIRRLEKSGYIIYQAVLSAVLAVVLFAVMALFCVAMDAKGMLKAINSLLGASLGTVTLARLVTLSLVMALAVGAGRLLIHVCLAWVKDAALMLAGGVSVRVSPAGDAPAGPPSPPAPRTVSSARTDTEGDRPKAG